jgi:hypothetical protein
MPRSAVPGQFYVVDDRPQASEREMVLEDGSMVICSAFDKNTARSVADSDKNWGVRRHSDLSETDQRQVSNRV